MQESYVDDSRKFTHFVHQGTDSVSNSSDEANTGLVTVLNRTLAKGWLNGKSSLHVHIGVRLVGETISHEFCCLFHRKRLPAEMLFQQDGFGVPTHDLGNIVGMGKGQLGTEGPVLIHIGEPFDYCEQNIAVVRLRFLDDCPRVPIDGYPIKNTELWVLPSELNFLQEALFAFIDRKLSPPTGFMTIAKDKLPYEMVKGRADVVKDISRNRGESSLWDKGQRVAYHDIPRSITPYMELTGVGLLFAPDSKFRFQGITVFFGPPELGPGTCEVSGVSNHMLCYQHEREEDAKDAQKS